MGHKYNVNNGCLNGVKQWYFVASDAPDIEGGRVKSWPRFTPTTILSIPPTSSHILLHLGHAGLATYLRHYTTNAIDVAAIRTKLPLLFLVFQFLRNILDF